MQLGGAECATQRLFPALHTTLSGCFVFTLGEPVGSSAFWRQVNGLISQAKVDVSRTVFMVRALQAPEEYSGWKELLGLVAVRGSWLRDTGSGWAEAGAHPNRLVLYRVYDLLTGRRKISFCCGF